MGEVPSCYRAGVVLPGVQGDGPDEALSVLVDDDQLRPVGCVARVPKLTRIAENDPSHPKTIVNDTYLAGTLRNIQGNWVFYNMTAGPSSPLSYDTYYYPIP